MYEGPFRIPSASTAARATATTGSTSWTDGHTWVSATPNAGGSAVSRSVTASGTKRPSSDTAFTVTSGPSTYSSASTTPPRDSVSAVSQRRFELVPPADERQPALALPVGGLHHAGQREAGVTRVEGACVRDAGLGERVALPRLRRGHRAGARVDRMREADPLRDPRRDPHGPVRPGGDDPVDVACACEPVDRLLVLRREHGALVGEREPDGLRVPVDGDHVEVAARPGGLEQAELGGPGA